MKTISFATFASLFTLIVLCSCGDSQDDKTYTLTTTVSPKEGGIITPSDEEFEKRAHVTLRATANEGWQFLRWEGDLNLTSPEVNLRMNDNYTIVGIFEREDKHEDWPRDTETTVVDVTSPTGRIWMDRNLGANRVAQSSTDALSYGDLYQWGRPADGHQKRNSATTWTASSTDQPGHSSFILVLSNPEDWRSPQNNNLWQGVNGVNNPCPPGYRLPTEAEWNAERRSWVRNNAAGAFNSPLKLPMAGINSGSLFPFGSHGYYWSSTVTGTRVRYMKFSNRKASMRSGYRAYGISVRCIKDE